MDWTDKDEVNRLLGRIVNADTMRRNWFERLIISREVGQTIRNTLTSICFEQLITGKMSVVEVRAWLEDLASGKKGVTTPRGVFS